MSYSYFVFIIIPYFGATRHGDVEDCLGLPAYNTRSRFVLYTNNPVSSVTTAQCHLLQTLAVTRSHTAHIVSHIIDRQLFSPLARYLCAHYARLCLDRISSTHNYWRTDCILNFHPVTHTTDTL